MKTLYQVFLSVSIVPVPRVPVKDRYAVTKVRTIDGIANSSTPYFI